MPTLKNLDKSPRIFFMPGDQVFPWALIGLGSYLILRKIAGLSWLWVIGVSGWGIATWWLLTYRGAHYFFGRLVRTPNWVRGTVVYRPLFAGEKVMIFKARKRRYR